MKHAPRLPAPVHPAWFSGKPAAVAALALSSALAVASGTPDDSAQALMRQAFPGWAPDQTTVITARGADGQPQRVTAAPKLVLPLDERHRALVVSGVQLLDTGMRIESHAAAANLGVYVFEQRDGRWVPSHATPSAGWTGFFGDPGQLRHVALGEGQVGLAVENSECWQGFCGAWLTLFAVTPTGTHQLLHMQTGSSSLAATEDCDDWLKGRLQARAGHDNPQRCFDIASRWQLVTPPGRDDADIVVRFTGRDARVDGRTGKPAVQPVRETLVLRRKGDRYVPVSGRNPAHNI